jgi:HK97 family phage major capsid protein
MSRLKILNERIFAGIPARAKAIRDLAEKEGRALTEAEQAEVAQLGDERKAALAEVEQLRSLDALTTVPADAARLALTDPHAAAFRDGAVVTGGRDLAAERPFKSFGEQLLAVHAAARGSADPRLMHLNAAASGLGEAAPADDGFLVQQDFSSELLKAAFEGGSILSLVREIPISSGANGLKINGVDETSRVNGSRWGGVQAYWAGEADTVTSSKPKFRKIELELEKLLAICYATDELVADATALESVISTAFREELIFKLEDAVVNGDGAGKPLGILNAGCVVSQAAEGAQTADTINATNVVKMRSRLPMASRSRFVWLINQDAEPQLPLMTIGNMPVYLPPGGITQAPYGTLLGRPVIPVEFCATVGDVGDIIAADLSQYVLITKGGPQMASSMHVRFVYDEMAFRFTYRADGQPAWHSAITPFKGSNTLSPFVTLAAR